LLFVHLNTDAMASRTGTRQSKSYRPKSSGKHSKQS